MRKIILLLGLALMAAPVRALQVTPTYQIFTLDAGEKTTGELTLTNTDGVDITVYPDVKDWSASTSSKAFPTPSWLKVLQSTFPFKAGESRTIRFTVQAPKKAKGEIMGMLTFETKNPQLATVAFRLSIGIYVAVKGTEKLAGEVRAISIRTSTHTATEDPTMDSVSAQLLLENTGNVHLRPHGFFQINNAGGENIANIEIKNPNPTFPGRTATYGGVVKDFRMTPGRYTVLITLDDIDRQVTLPPFRKSIAVTKEGNVELK